MPSICGLFFDVRSFYKLAVTVSLCSLLPFLFFLSFFLSVSSFVVTHMAGKRSSLKVSRGFMLIIYLLKQRSLACYQYSCKLRKKHRILVTNMPEKYFDVSLKVSSGFTLTVVAVPPQTAVSCSPQTQLEKVPVPHENYLEVSCIISVVSHFLCDLIKLVATIFLCSVLLFLLLCLGLNHSLCSSSPLISRSLYTLERRVLKHEESLEAG